MKLSGNNVLSITRQTGLSFETSIITKDLTNKKIGFSGDQNFAIEFLNNKIINPQGKIISTFNTGEELNFSGDLFNNKYNLYLNSKVISFNKNYSFNYFDHFYINSPTEIDLKSLAIKGKIPEISISIPAEFYVGENINCAININNMSAKIYSGEINDLSSGSKSSFILSNLPTNSGGLFLVKTTGAVQDTDYKSYPIELNLYTNFGTIKNNYTLTGKYKEYQDFVELRKILDQDNYPIGSSGRVVYSLEYDISSGEQIISPDIIVSFSYYSGFTGLESASITGTGTYNINYTGNVLGSGVVYSQNNASYILTGRNLLNDSIVTGNVNLNLNKFIYLNGTIQNTIQITGTGLSNKSISNNQNLIATGKDLIQLNGSGNIIRSGAITGVINNQIGSGSSSILQESGSIFQQLNATPIESSIYSGLINTGYIINTGYFTGSLSSYQLNNLRSTGFITGKNETLFVYSGDGLSGLFTGNVLGSGNINVQENYSVNQRVTGNLSGDINKRQIVLDLPTINLSTFTYFTGNYNVDLNLPIVGTASGRDQNNLEVITNVTGGYGLNSGFLFNSNDSGVKYVSLNNNFISKNPVELARYSSNSFNFARNTGSLITYFNEKNDKLYVGYEHPLNEFYILTGNRNNWTQVNAFTGTGSFGFCSAISNDENTLLISAPTSGAGIINIYNKQQDNTWTSTGVMAFTNTSPAPRFGISCDINNSGTVFIVGAPNFASGSTFLSGAAVIYTGSGLNWSIEQILRPNNPTTELNHFFGTNVAINGAGNKVAVVCRTDQINSYGALYIYEKNQTWDLTRKIIGLFSGGNNVAFDKSEDIIVFDSGVVSPSATGYLSIIQNRTGAWDLIRTISGAANFGKKIKLTNKIISYSETSGSESGICYIFNKSGSLENTINNFNFYGNYSSIKSAIATLNNDLDIYIITGTNPRIVYFSGGFDHLNLKSNNLAYQNIDKWLPLNTFVNIPQTLTVLGSGNMSVSSTKNYTNLQINNKVLLQKCQSGGSSASTISEINSKLFTGIWSGTGIIQSTNEVLTFNESDSGIKSIVGTKTGVPTAFKILNSLGDSYVSESNSSGNFSGYFSGDVFGSGLCYKNVSGYPTGVISSGQLMTGLYFNVENFDAQISAPVVNGLMIINNFVTGVKNQNGLTGFVSIITPSGYYSSGFIENVTGLMNNAITYTKSFQNSFPYVKTGLDFINQSDLPLISNVYTGNLLNASSNRIYLDIGRAPSYSYNNSLSGRLNVLISSPHGDIITGDFIDL